MTKVIPFFYADLLARVVPGSVTLLLFFILDIKLPCTWTTWINESGNAQVILVPTIYAGSAYLIGLVYESMLNPIIHRTLYLCAFRNALNKYLDDTSQNINMLLNVEDSNKLGWLSANVFHHITANNNMPDSEHAIRIHSEAKMFSFLVAPLILFIIALLYINSTSVATDHVTNNFIQYLLASILTIPIVLRLSYLRFHRRALHIIRFVEYYPEDCKILADKVRSKIPQYISRWKTRANLINYMYS